MEPIRYVDALIEHYGAMGFPPYKWTVNETAPLHPPSKPLAESTVSILVSGGISECNTPGDREGWGRIGRLALRMARGV